MHCGCQGADAVAPVPVKQDRRQAHPSSVKSVSSVDKCPLQIPSAEPVGDDWWYIAFPIAPYESKPPGALQMVYLVAYDIADPKRLHRVAKVCEDYGVRVQYSLFECRLEPDEFDRLWRDLVVEMDPDEDRAVAYPLDARCVRETQTAGTMTCTERTICYLV